LVAVTAVFDIVELRRRADQATFRDRLRHNVDAVAIGDYRWAAPKTAADADAARSLFSPAETAEIRRDSGGAAGVAGDGQRLSACLGDLRGSK
jgi:hypothetical protein